MKWSYMSNTISNSKFNSQVNGTSNDDYIYNEAHHVTITAGKGDDVVELATGSRRSVYKYASGEGSITLKDTKADNVVIKFQGKCYRYINGRAFNDPDYNSNNFYSNDPVTGTGEADYINVGGDKVTINAGDGNDVIADFTNGDVIKLGSKKTKVNTKKSKVSGNDYILKIGKNTIKLTGAANQSITVIDYAGNSQTYNVSQTYDELFNKEYFNASALDDIIEPRTENYYEVNSHNESIINCINDGNVIGQQQSECHTYGQINNVCDS